MAKWSKQTYEAVARELRAEVEYIKDLEQTLLSDGEQYTAGTRDVVYALTHRFARLFAEDNPRFDRARFEHAVYAEKRKE